MVGPIFKTWTFLTDFFCIFLGLSHCRVVMAQTHFGVAFDLHSIRMLIPFDHSLLNCSRHKESRPSKEIRWLLKKYAFSKRRDKKRLRFKYAELRFQKYFCFLVSLSENSNFVHGGRGKLNKRTWLISSQIRFRSEIPTESAWANFRQWYHPFTKQT